MKRLLTLAVLLCLCLAACGREVDVASVPRGKITLGEEAEAPQNIAKGVSLVVPAGGALPEKILCNLINEQNSELTTEGKAFLQKKENGIWYAVEDGELDFTYWNDELLPGTYTQLRADWSERWGALPRGTYRIVKEICVEGQGSCFLLAEFELP